MKLTTLFSGTRLHKAAPYRLRGGASEGVAQIFNLPYRRFSTCKSLHSFGREADYKSAIQQIANLRYGARRQLPISPRRFQISKSNI